MSEQLENLRTTLRELETELASLSTVDKETRSLLEEVAGEIQSALHKEDTSQLEPHSLISRLKEGTEQFESSHPTLFGLVSRIIDGIGQLGI